MKQVYFCQIATGHVYCLAEEERITWAGMQHHCWQTSIFIRIWHVSSLERWSYYQNKKLKCHCDEVQVCISICSCTQNSGMRPSQKCTKMSSAGWCLPRRYKGAFCSSASSLLQRNSLICLSLTQLCYSRQSTSTIEVLKKFSSKESLYFLKKNMCCK